MLTIVQRGPANLQKATEIVRGPRTRMPWAWDGLCFGVPFAENSLDGYREIVNNVPLASALGAFWSTDSRGNPSVAFDPAVNGYLEYPSHPQHDRPSTELTVYVRLRRLGVGSVYGGYITNVYSTSSPWESWMISEGSALNGATSAAIAVNGTSYTLPDTAIIPTTEYVSAFLRWRSGGAADLTVLNERGIPLTSSNSGSAITGSISYNSGQPVRINASESVGIVAYATYSQAMVWTRRLSDTEITQIAVDPFGWYSPRRETIGLSSPYPLAFGGGEMRQGTMIGGLP